MDGMSDKLSEPRPKTSQTAVANIDKKIQLEKVDLEEKLMLMVDDRVQFLSKVQKEKFERELVQRDEAAAQSNKEIRCEILTKIGQLKAQLAMSDELRHQEATSPRA